MEVLHPIGEKWCVIVSGAKQSGFDEVYPGRVSWKARLLRFARNDRDEPFLREDLGLYIGMATASLSI